MRTNELTLGKFLKCYVKGPIVCPDRPILLSSKATHFALNSVSLFSLSLLTSGNCCENLTCHGKRGGGEGGGGHYHPVQE